MITALPLPRLLRNPSWHVALLLPVIPLVLVGWHESSPFGRDAFPAAPSMLLLVIGLGVALGIPGALGRLGWAVRKEAEQLRPAWLAGLFITQMTGALGNDGIPVACMVFGLTCALVAAFTFGAEFHQRTMSALLSQPMDRRHFWSTKLGVLGVALVTHLLVFQLSLQASGLPAITASDAQAWTAVAGIVFAVLAWATTPTWTLMTQSAIAGLVFSVATPLVSFALLASFGQESLAIRAGLALAVPYSAVLFALGRRRWLRLEAPDAQGESMGGLFALPLQQATPGRSNGAGWVRRSVGKEFRLQTVTFATVMVTVLLLGLMEFSRESVARRELLTALVFLFGGITILLAGATPIAEERRLGTLAEQVLRPASIASQWWLKLSVSALPAVLAVVAMLGAASMNWGGTAPDPLMVGLAALVAFSAFAFCLHASSGASSTLRALLTGMVVTGACFLIVTAASVVVAETGSSISERLWASMRDQPQIWLDEAARQLPAAASPVLGPWESRWQDPAIQILRTWVPILAAVFGSLAPVLSLVFARANFARPAGAPQRLLPQQGWIAALLVGLSSLGGATALLGLEAMVRADCRDQTLRHLDIERHLSPAERLLRRHHLNSFRATISTLESVTLPCRIFENRTANAAAAATPRTTNRTFLLPLSPADREQILEGCDLPPAIRNALIAEGEPKGNPGPPPRP